MKEYLKPTIELEVLEIEDIIAESNTISLSGSFNFYSDEVNDTSNSADL